LGGICGEEEGGMEETVRRRSLILFCLRFLGLVSVLVVLWWLLLPLYGKLLAEVAGMMLRLVFAVPVEYSEIRADGILNTRSLLVMAVEGRESAMPIAMLVTNVPPYLALVLATLGLGLRRRIAVLIYGTSILAAGHVLFLVYALRFQLAARAAAT